MTLRVVADEGREPSPFLATAIALTRSQADQWREENALRLLAEQRRSDEAERPFRVLVNGEVVPFAIKRFAEIYAEISGGVLLPEVK